jgi:hypothetical protein
MEDSGLSTALTSDSEPTGTGSVFSGANSAPNIPASNTAPPEAPDIGAPTPPAPNLGTALGAAQPDLPRFQRTFGNTLKGMLVGFGLGGIPGAVAGGINPRGAQSALQQNAAMVAANQHFASARAAHETASAAMLEKQVNAFDEEHQKQMERLGLDNLKAAQDAGFRIVSVTPLDGDPADNSKAAMNNLQEIQKNNGGKVPEGLLHIHGGNGNGIFTLQLQDPAAALGAINQTRRAQGLAEVDSNTFMSLHPGDRQQMAKDAINFTMPTDPRTGQISQESVTTLENRLGLVKAQPEFNGKDALVTNLQRSLDFQKSALQHEATRKGQAAGAEAQGAQPGKTAAEVANINATAGPEAAAAGLKAGAEQKARNAADLAALGNSTDLLGNTVSPPAGGVREYNKRLDSFKKDADELAKTEGTYGMFNNVLNDINAGKDVTGAKSVVALFNAIGLSATPLKGMGMRINSNTVQEHIGARGLGQSIYQKLLSLKNGDVITPQQIKDYADIALQARRDAYVNKINEARSQGVKPDFLLPRGNGRKVDANTAQIFYETAAGNTPQEKAANARRAAQAVGWQ